VSGEAVAASDEPLRVPSLAEFLRSLDRRVLALFLVAVALCLADVVIPELFAGGKTKDYELWFNTGRAALNGGDIYAGRGDGLLSFLYPPFAAVLLAPLSLLGKPLMYGALALINAGAWVVVAAALRILCARAPHTALSDLLPSLICGSLIFLTFDLGQPNLLLLAFILAGFVAIEAGRRGLGGALIGFAAAIKAFPIAILLYLLARRQWRAAIAMVVALAIFSLAVPALVFGPTKAVADLSRWTSAMTSLNEQVFGQRPNHNWSYHNQSLFALTHRLTRPIDAAESPTPAGAFTINVVDLGFAGANRVYLALCALIGGGFLFLLAKSDARRREVRVAELAILLSLDVVASPEAHDYYFVWLIFPIAALIDFYRTARPGRDRRVLAVSLAGAMVCMALAINGAPIVFQAYGCLDWAVAFLIFGLVFEIALRQAGAADSATPSPRNRAAASFPPNH
jgi:hypothetical protein